MELITVISKIKTPCIWEVCEDNICYMISFLDSKDIGKLYFLTHEIGKQNPFKSMIPLCVDYYIKPLSVRFFCFEKPSFLDFLQIRNMISTNPIKYINKLSDFAGKVGVNVNICANMYLTDRFMIFIMRESFKYIIVYDLAKKEFSKISIPRSKSSFAFSPYSGKLWIIGGYPDNIFDENPSSEIFVLDIFTKEMKRHIYDFTNGISNSSGIFIDEKRILLIRRTGLSDLIFNIDDGSIKDIGVDSLYNRIIYIDGIIYKVCGYKYYAVYRFDVEKCSWGEHCKMKPSTDRLSYTCFGYNGKLYFLGGRNDTYNLYTSYDFYDIGKNKFDSSKVGEKLNFGNTSNICGSCINYF